MYETTEFVPNLIIPAVITAVILGLWASMFTRIRILKSLSISIVVNAITTVWLAISRTGPHPISTSAFDPVGHDQDHEIIAVWAIFVTVNLCIAMGIKLYRAAVLGKASSPENQKGAIGIRAWLLPVNITIVAGLTIAAYMAFNYSPVGTILLGLFALLAYPLFNTLQSQSVFTSAPPQAPADERERVLALVEAGKITAEDAAELLSALAQSHVAGIETSSVITGPRRIIMAGAAIVLVGFLLPWFTLDIPKAADMTVDTVKQMMSQINNSNLPPGFSMQPPPVAVRTVNQFSLNGGDVTHGLGWIALIAGLLVAGLPFFWTSPNGVQLRNMTLAVLIAGSVAMLYLLSNSFNAITSINAGFLITIGGYVVLWIGIAREYFIGVRLISPHTPFSPA